MSDLRTCPPPAVQGPFVIGNVAFDRDGLVFQFMHGVLDGFAEPFADL